MPNPSTIMGANALEYWDVEDQASLFQNSDGTGAVADADPVGRWAGQLSNRNLTQPDNTSARPLYEETAQAHLLFDGSNDWIEDTAGYSGAGFYFVGRLYVSSSTADGGRVLMCSKNGQDFAAGGNINTFVSGNDLGFFVSGLGFYTRPMPRDQWFTLEIGFTGSSFLFSIDGSDVTATGTFTAPIFDRMTIAANRANTGSPSNIVVMRSARVAISDVIPDSTQRLTLLDWAENGDVGGGDPVEVEVPAAAIGVTAAAPTISGGASNAIPAASIGLAPQPPSVSSGASIVSGIAEIVQTAHAPRVAAGKSVAVPTAAISIGTGTPSLATGAVAFLAAASIAIAGFAPSISTGVRVDAPTAAIAAAPLAPSIISGARVDVPSASIAVQANLPSLGAGTTITIPAAAVQVLGVAPEVRTGAVVAVPGAGVAIAGLAPVVGSGVVIRVPAASVALAALVPTIEAASLAFVDVPVAQIAVSGIAPQIIIGAPPVLSARRVATPGQSANGGRLIASANGGRLIQSRNGGRLV